MEELKVAGWSNWESEYPNIDFNVYDQGTVIGCVLNEVTSKGLVFSAQDHQYHPLGVPVFDNGTCLRCSMRAWAYIMASSRGSNDYMEYYMDVPEESVLPSNEAKVPADEAEKDNGALPVIIGPDQELIMESVSMGVELMTTDKALKIMFPLYKQKYGN